MTIADKPTAPHVSRGLSFARLIRLPNLFTAPPDVLVGFGLVAPWNSAPLALAMVIASTILLYASGMLWNDYFDIDEDRRERPQRPLPSGQFSLSFARNLAVVCMIVGIGLADVVGLKVGVVAILLAASILLYDGLLKQMTFAPIVMGGCRFLNVLLGTIAAVALTPGTDELYRRVLIVAVANGLYITGVTFFARQEATRSSRYLLAFGAAVMGLGILLHVGRWTIDQAWNPYLMVLLAGFLLAAGIPVTRGIVDPAPNKVQAGVKYSIWGLVLLNGCTAAAFMGPWQAGIIVAHVLPMYWLGRKIYST